MTRRLWPSALALLLLAACEQKAAPAPEETATPAVPVPTATPATTAAQQEQAAGQEIDDGLKLEQDFEEQAYEQITAENTLSELDKVEKEIKDAEKALPPASAAKAASPAAGGAAQPPPAPAAAKPASQ